MALEPNMGEFTALANLAVLRYPTGISTSGMFEDNTSWTNDIVQTLTYLGDVARQSLKRRVLDRLADALSGHPAWGCPTATAMLEDGSDETVHVFLAKNGVESQDQNGQGTGYQTLFEKLGSVLTRLTANKYGDEHAMAKTELRRIILDCYRSRLHDNANDLRRTFVEFNAVFQECLDQGFGALDETPQQLDHVARDFLVYIREQVYPLQPQTFDKQQEKVLVDSSRKLREVDCIKDRLERLLGKRFGERVYVAIDIMSRPHTMLGTLLKFSSILPASTNFEFKYQSTSAYTSDSSKPPLTFDEIFRTLGLPVVDNVTRQHLARDLDVSRAREAFSKLQSCTAQGHPEMQLLALLTQAHSGELQAYIGRSQWCEFRVFTMLRMGQLFDTRGACSKKREPWSLSTFQPLEARHKQAAKTTSERMKAGLRRHLRSKATKTNLVHLVRSMPNCAEVLACVAASHGHSATVTPMLAKANSPSVLTLDSARSRDESTKRSNGRSSSPATPKAVRPAGTSTGLACALLDSLLLKGEVPRPGLEAYLAFGFVACKDEDEAQFLGRLYKGVLTRKGSNKPESFAALRKALEVNAIVQLFDEHGFSAFRQDMPQLQHFLQTPPSKRESVWKLVQFVRDTENTEPSACLLADYNFGLVKEPEDVQRLKSLYVRILARITPLQLHLASTQDMLLIYARAQGVAISADEEWLLQTRHDYSS